MAKTRPLPRRTGGGYKKKATDYITVEECIILIHHHVKLAIAAERERIVALESAEDVL